MTRLRAAAAALAALTLLLAAPALAQSPAPTPSPAGGVPGISATSAILVHASDGRILFSRNVHQKRPPASMTKVVTALVARDVYKLDEVVTSTNAVMQPGGSRLGLEPGTKLTVRELLFGLLLKSGNDAAMALAAHHPAGYEAFLDLMNQKARALGAFESNFVNPHGLDMPGHMSSAWDMALFGRAVLDDPVLAQIVATPSYSLQVGPTKRTFDNHNKLLKRYPGTIGIKTGFTNRAGHCLVAAANTPGGTVITVVMNSPGRHYADTTALFEYAKARAAAERSGAQQAAIAPPLAPRLAEPPAVPKVVEAAGPVKEPPATPHPDYRWGAVAALLAAAMLATLYGPRRLHPLREASVLHGYLEPLVPPEHPWEAHTDRAGDVRPPALAGRHASD